MTRGAATLNRPDESAAEIVELMDMGSSDLKHAVQQRGATLRLETLAYLVRRACGPHSGVELLELATRQLLKRVRPIARSIGHRAVATNADWEDGTQHAVFAMLREFEETPADHLTFWEVNFRSIFKLRCIDGLIAQRRKVDRSAVPVEASPDDNDELHAPAFRPLDRLTIREVLSCLSPDEAVAVQLAWFDGYPISGDRSVSELMAVSRKTVHQYIARAKAKLEADPRFGSWIEHG